MGLTTPADFSQPREASESPALPSGSRLVLGPAQIPLPDSPDRDLRDPVAIAEARGKQRQGKENTERAPKRARAAEDDEDDPRAGAKRGRPSGSNNYSPTDIQVLLDFVEDECPLGQKGWQAIHSKYSEWARDHERPPRKAMSLETKFKQLVKTTKPTGDGVCPPDVTRAHEIDALINERAGTRDLNDSDFDADNSHDDLRNATPPIEHTAVTRATRTDAPVPRCRGAAASELLTRISRAFDPAVQEARDEQRANRSIANTQLLTQAQQLRDTNAVTEQLRTQLYDMRSKLYTVERERDLSQLRVEMMQMHGSAPNPAPRHAHPNSAPRHARHRHKPKQPSYTYYPDGGQSVIWHSETETLTNMSDRRSISPHFTDVTPTDFGTTPSPRRGGPSRWASRPRSRGGYPRNTVVCPSCSRREGIQEPTDPNSREDACEPLSTEV
ncbi:hypothetical protein DFJ58DRAFT_723609 [Suillus subalutaceus]|uniref:uncharacterized protein n=1 Tax=Suillus subalutaceus TaxID=48586 RepID=UPI001B869335|nr:uncharacterized protein DFJ58DRAFT_723609 [Suillus subalutaceus]KAG1868350.1 hypothetical protein DFJ58DRAFT_723609 [Suillus subalutaceus]